MSPTIASAATVGDAFAVTNIITTLVLNLFTAAAAVKVVAFLRRLRSRRASREGVRSVFFSGGPGLLFTAFSRSSGASSPPLDLVVGVLVEQLEELGLRAQVSHDHGPSIF